MLTQSPSPVMTRVFEFFLQRDDVRWHRFSVGETISISERDVPVEEVREALAEGMSYDIYSPQTGERIWYLTTPACLPICESVYSADPPDVVMSEAMCRLVNKSGEVT